LFRLFKRGCSHHQINMKQVKPKPRNLHRSILPFRQHC
ncbi:unnamed protein product, partial [Allacma fusca]